MSAVISSPFRFPLLLVVAVLSAGFLTVSAPSVQASVPDVAPGMAPPIPLPIAVPNTAPGNAPVPVPMPPAEANAEPAQESADVTALTEAEKRLTLEALRDKIPVTLDETWVYQNQIQYLEMLRTFNTSRNSVQ